MSVCIQYSLTEVQQFYFSFVIIIKLLYCVKCPKPSQCNINIIYQQTCPLNISIKQLIQVDRKFRCQGSGCCLFTWPRLPQILAWMEGYICFSLIVMVMSLSKMAVTRWRLASSLCLQKRTRFSSQGVMYSRHRCFSSIPVTETRHLWALR